jgi:hypothetical protein
MTTRKLLFATVAALIMATTPALARYDFTYLCQVDGKTYPLQVDENKHVLKWMENKYHIVIQPDCAKYGWHAEGYGMSFDFCTATQGGAGFDIANASPRNDIQCCMQETPRRCQFYP